MVGHAQDHRREIDESRDRPAGRGETLCPRESEAEVDKQRRRQQRRPNIGPIDEAVEGVKPRGIAEAEENEGGQGEKIKMMDHRPGAPRQQDGESDGQVRQTDDPLEGGDNPTRRRDSDNDASLNRSARTLDVIRR